jgi:hypothetical protein
LLAPLDTINHRTQLDLPPNSEVRVCHYQAGKMVSSLKGPLRVSVSGDGVTGSVALSLIRVLSCIPAKKRLTGALMGSPHAICSVMARLIALVIVATALAACAGHVADYIPTWAGGPPKDLPPRPGTPEYDAYRQKMDDEVTRDKSKDPPKPKTDSGITGLPK